jgi:hypothetical protein
MATAAEVKRWIVRHPHEAWDLYEQLVRQKAFAEAAKIVRKHKTISHGGGSSGDCSICHELECAALVIEARAKGDLTKAG